MKRDRLGRWLARPSSCALYIERRPIWLEDGVIAGGGHPRRSVGWDRLPLGDSAP